MSILWLNISSIIVLAVSLICCYLFRRKLRKALEERDGTGYVFRAGDSPPMLNINNKK